MILKNYKIAVWLAFIIIAVAAIGPRLDPEGYRISSLGKEAPDSLQVGLIIYEINGQKASSEVLDGPYTGLVRLRTDKGDIFLRANGTLGIGAEKVEPTNLRFGLDIKGGINALIKLNDSSASAAEQVRSTLENRINLFGLREAVFRTVNVNGENFIEISIAGGNRQELVELLQTQGKFEGRITFSASSLSLDKKYNITFSGGDAVIGNISVAPGGSFSLDGIDFVYNSRSGGRANLTAVVFSGSDIRTVFFDPQRSRIENIGDGYQWSFGIQISPESAGRFAKVTKNAAVLGSHLDASISLYLDGGLIDTLSIASSLKGRVETEISVSGVAGSMKEAASERARLQAVLRSGALPTAIEVVSTDTISPTLGSDFIKNAALAGLGAVLGVVAIVLVRYRRLKLVAPMLATSLSEIVIILGIATAIGWTIDLAAIAAIIATVGTGVNSQIIIIDQALRGGGQHAETLREKFGRAFFIIFGSAGTMIAAMLPLLFSPFSLLKGFAIITIIGVLTGVLIARPAFSVMVERVLKKNS